MSHSCCPEAERTTLSNPLLVLVVKLLLKTGKESLEQTCRVPLGMGKGGELEKRDQISTADPEHPFGAKMRK